MTSDLRSSSPTSELPSSSLGADGTVARVGQAIVHTEFDCFNTGLTGNGHFATAEYLRSRGVWMGYIKKYGKSFDGLPSFEDLKRDFRPSALPHPLAYEDSAVRYTTSAVCGGCLSETSAHIPVTSIKFVDNQKLTIMLFSEFNRNGLFCILLPTRHDKVPSKIQSYQFYKIGDNSLDTRDDAFTLLVPRRDSAQDTQFPARRMVLSLMKAAVPSLIVRLPIPAALMRGQQTPLRLSETVDSESIQMQDRVDGFMEELPQDTHAELYDDPPAREKRQAEETMLTDESRKRRRVEHNSGQESRVAQSGSEAAYEYSPQGNSEPMKSQTRREDLSLPEQNRAEQVNASAGSVATLSTQPTPDQQRLEEVGNVPITWMINRTGHEYYVNLSLDRCKSFDGLLTCLLGKTKYVDSIPNFIRETVSWRLDFELLESGPKTFLYDAGEGSRLGSLKSMLAKAPVNWVRDDLVIQLTPSHLQPHRRNSLP